MKSRLIAALSFLFASSSLAFANPNVVVSIAPLHSLVAQVMEGVATPQLLLSGTGSEHQASFGPQQLQSLAKADVVFIIGQGLELKLDELSGSEAVSGKKFVEAMQFQGLKKRALREGGVWESDEHQHDHNHDHDAEKEASDPHIWLSTANAEVIVKAVAAELARVDTANADRYTANAEAASQRLQSLNMEVAETLAPVKTKPFLVFHDAYQYFEADFGLNGVGSISDASAAQPSAQRLAEVRKKFETAKANCVFREPQFSEAAALAVIEGTSAKLGTIDPLGADINPGPEAYSTLLRGLAKNMVACLSN